MIPWLCYILALTQIYTQVVFNIRYTLGWSLNIGWVCTQMVLKYQVHIQMVLEIQSDTIGGYFSKQ